MKKIILPKFSKITFIFSAILLGIYFLISNLEKADTYVYLFGLGTREILPSAKILCIALLTSALAVLIFKNIRREALSIILTVVVSVCALWYCTLICFSSFLLESKYYEYKSDDNSHHIVVREIAGFHEVDGIIYEKTSVCTMKPVGYYDTNDRYKPFLNNDVFFVWNENKFELHYAYLKNPDPMYKVVEMEYVK